MRSLLGEWMHFLNGGILHELVHTKHKNHSKKFWKEIDRYVGDGKKLRKEMRGYRLGV